MRETRLCHPSAIARDRFSRVVSTFLYNHCQARANQFVIRDWRSAARKPPCCLTNCMNAKITITVSDPHNRIDRISAQVALLVSGNIGSAGGRTGKGGGGAGRKAGGGPPNKKNGNPAKSTIRLIIICPIKKRMLIRKLINVARTENRPRLSPAGSRLTMTPRIRRKIKL